MRITITLDPDAQRLLKQVMRERGVSFKQAVNDSVRAGVLGSSAPIGGSCKNRSPWEPNNAFAGTKR